MVRPVLLTAAWASSFFTLSMKMVPHNHAANANGWIYKISFFAITVQLSMAGHSSASTNRSSMLWWLMSMTQPEFRTICSWPSRLVFTPIRRQAMRIPAAGILEITVAFYFFLIHWVGCEMASSERKNDSHSSKSSRFYSVVECTYKPFRLSLGLINIRGIGAEAIITLATPKNINFR
jgi:hypothetical protein